MVMNSCDTNWSRLGFPLMTGLFGPLVRRLWIAKVEGLDNIPDTGPVIICLNHESYFDFICFSAVVKRKIHWLAGEKFFQHPVWRWVMRLMGCIRVDRCSTINLGALKEIRHAVSQGGMVAIFPEGTRSSDGRLLRGKPGAAYLALKSGVPVIPVGISGTYEILSRHDRFPKLHKATIRVGEPLMLSKTGSGKGIDMQRITDEIMLRIADLTGEEYPYAVEEKSKANFAQLL